MTEPTTHALDAKGRCCGRKPIDYKGGAWNSPLQAQKFCWRCNRAYDRTTGVQIENWAFVKAPGGFIPKPPAPLIPNTRSG